MTQQETLTNGTIVCVNDIHRFGADAMLLSYFSNIRRNETVCELGSGCGIISLRLLDNGHKGICTAVEINAEASELLCQAIQINNCTNIKPVCGDLKSYNSDIPCDAVICNPPYFKGGYKSVNDDKRTARHETMCTIEDVCHTASRLLKDGGRLCVCQRPSRLADVICAMRNERIEPKVLRFVQQRESSENPWLFLLQGQKNRASGLTMQKSLIVENDKGDFSDEIKAIYGIKY